ncbi:F-box domain-containing protein [Mycena chlorophos]|uniref:F-box domain-containing protein n=1 Tax=Mycena chlorophos TaxID=658473 RepID=A0A8H6WJK7_MYCCL|nr:F-box domain-containing protein [Mycena chlorophos]
MPCVCALLADMTATTCPCLENLEYLSLDFAGQTQIELEAKWAPQTPAFLTARKLARVKLLDTPLASLFLPWAQLTDLDMRPFHTSAAQSFDALRQCTAAVRICVATGCWSANESAPSAPHLLPHLEQLYLTFTDETCPPGDAENENMAPLLRGLTLPALKDLKLYTIGYGWPEQIHSDFIDFLRRAPHIATLKFYTDFDAVALRDILAVTPSLRELTLNSCSNAMGDPVIEYLTYDPNDIQAPSVPQLRILQIDHVSSGWNIDPTKLQAMIESRWSGYLQGLTEDKRTQVSPWEKVVLRTRQRARETLWLPFCARVAELKHFGLDISIS